MTWILVIFAYIGMWSDKDSMALTNVPGFTTQQACEVAAAQARKTFEGGTKEVKTLCIQQSK